MSAALLMARIDPIADAAPAADFASSRRGSAMLASTPMIPQTKSKSISAKPCACAWRFLTKRTLLRPLQGPAPSTAELVPSSTNSHSHYLQQFTAVAFTSTLTLYVMPQKT